MRNWRRLSLLLAALAVAVPVFGAGAPKHSVKYTVRSLPFVPLLINNRGEIVTTIVAGKYSPHSMNRNEPPTHLGLWKRGKLHDLGNLPGDDFCDPLAMNDQEEILGQSGEYAMLPGDYDNFDTFLWSRGRMRRISSTMQNQTMNGHGTIVGMDEFPDGQQGFVYENGHEREVANPLHGPRREIVGINDKGDMVGWAEAPDSPHNRNPILVPYLWREGVPTALQFPPDWSYPQVAAINNEGQMLVGMEKVPLTHIFFGKDGKWTEIASLPGKIEMQFRGLNDHGEVVADAYSLPEHSDLDHTACLWVNGHTYDLNTLIAPHSAWKLLSVTGINNRGQIIGQGLFHGKRHGFLLTPAGKG